VLIPWLMPCDHGGVGFRAMIGLLTMLGLFAVSAVSFASAPTVVLGSRSFAGSQGAGWGTAHPREIFNGGDPSGLVTHIRWSSWGGPSASGRGKNAIFKPQGGYYKQLVTIQLRGTDRGRCTKQGPLAYRKLYVREPSRPGGPVGKWSLWSVSKTLCRFGF
jgi:hypothetical protein